MSKIDFSKFSLALLQELKKRNDERQHDAEFINGRGDVAAAEFEAARREGCTGDQAMERAHAVLMEGLPDE